MARTLLIVDDIRSNRAILKNMLGGDYQILEAENGREAIAIMEAEYAQISAVLLDLGMPVMDGFEVLSYMRESEILSSLPVIVTTGQTDSGSEERALELGANDYISKPYKSSIILKRIWNTINLRETAATINALKRDRLTGLYSRDAFFEYVRSAVRAHEPGYYIMSSFDVDKFRVINDQYGTEKGDAVLRYIANVFAAGFEPVGGICCRIGSDDFAVLYPAYFRNSQRLAELRERAGTVEGIAAPIAFSIGRYLVTDVNMSPSAMYDRAMLASDSIKGRFDVHIANYDDTMRASLLHEQMIVTTMADALASDQFEVWYQPQYNHATGALIGAEALVRWRHPDHGLIPPADFIPVFEKNGFVYSLDCYVWESVCSYLRGELDAGRSPLPVSVNVSRYDVFCPGFVDFITGLTEKYSLKADMLRLEVTESAFANDQERIVTVVKQLIDFGFLLEIDDFGSGYSSLNTLKNVPAQVLKLDMRFLDDDDGSRRGGNILESVVRMSKWLGMSVIAEGVEKKAQADYLLSIGCTYVQGFLYARPMPEADYRALCMNAGKEEKLLTMETVDNLDNDAFWDPDSMDTLIFNSYVGAACVYEYHNGIIELLRASEKFAQMLGGTGVTAKQALSIDWMSCLEPESFERLKQNLKLISQTKEESTDEYVFVGLLGCEEKTYLRSTMRVIATAGERSLVYCINENITAQRESEQHAHALTVQLQTVLDNVVCGISATVLSGRRAEFVMTNNRYYALLGYTKAQYDTEIGSDAFKTVYHEDIGLVSQTVQSVIDTGEPADIEYRAVQRGGSIIWLRSYISMGDFASVNGKVQIATYSNITARKNVELDLLSTTAQLRTMMNDMPGGFVRLRIEASDTLIPVYVNEGFLKLTGMSYDELLDVYTRDKLAGTHPDDVSGIRTFVSQLKKDGSARAKPYRLIRSDGSSIWVSAFGRATAGTSGERFLNIYFTDVSDEVKVERRQKELLDNLPYGVALYEYDGESLSIRHLNKRYWELVGRTSAAYSSSEFLNTVYFEDREIIQSELSTAIREERDATCNVRILYGKDSYRPFSITGRILKNDSGVYSIYAAFTPITDEAMSVQEMLPIALSAMMDSQSEYSFVKNKNLRYVCLSRSVASAMGLNSPEEAVGKSDHEIFEVSLADAFVSDDRHVLTTGESMIDRIDKLPSKTGGDCYACTSKFPLKDSQGNIVGVYGIGHDITETNAMKTQFELLTNTIPGGIASYQYAHGELRLTYFNEGFMKLFEIDAGKSERVYSADVYHVVFEEDLSALKEKIAELINGSDIVDCVYRVHTDNSSYKWISIKASVTERSDEAVKFNAVLLDVTQRQETFERLRISEEENRLAMQHTGSTICRYEIATRTLRLTELAQNAFSLPAEMNDVPDAPVKAGEISADTADVYVKFFTEIMSGSKAGTVAYRRKKGGLWRWIEAHYSTVFTSSGEPKSAVISFSDITEQLERDQAYHRWLQGIQEKDPALYTLFRCNVAKETSFSSAKGELLSAQLVSGSFDFDEHTVQYARKFVFEGDRERFIAFLNADALLAAFYSGKRISTIEYRHVSTDCTRWLKLTADLVRSAHSYEVEAYLLFEDIDQAKRSELKTIAQAETDALTGVMNRNTFSSRVNAIISDSGPNARHALMMLDMDGFKRVNDAFGHRTGDQALVDISEALKNTLSDDNLIGRIGGDEFMVFVPDIASDSIASDRAKQICAITRKSYSAEVEISSSIGIAIIPRDGTDFDTLYKKADAALYHVKGSGKNNYAFYQEDMESEHMLLETHPGEQDSALRRHKRRMLIVDDSRIDHALLSNIFEDQFLIEKARDGNSALIRLRHYGSAISVVLLDLVMPGMDGFAVLRKMQESAELRSVPVIVVSSDENRETGLRAIREGAVDFVNKPVDPDILRVRVQSVISKIENERLRVKNRLLEYENSEITRYRTALEHSGITVVEHDWVSGTFIYDSAISEFVLGTFDERSLWHILLSDLVADTKTVQRMQELVLGIATSKKQTGDTMLVQLKTPAKTKHWFRMHVYKVINEYGLAGKIYMTFVDVGTQN